MLAFTLMSQLFASTYDWVMGPLERGPFRSLREALLHEANGLVLEIGAGTGINFPLYRNADGIVALEPDLDMLQRSRPRQASASAHIESVAARAEALPFPAACFDTVVATLVLCTVRNPLVTVREITRVLKPGGSLFLFEHVRLHRPALAAMQDFLTPAWKHVAGGCHLNRDTVPLLEREGYAVNRLGGWAGGLFTVARAHRPQ